MNWFLVIALVTSPSLGELQLRQLDVEAFGTR